ncbi:MAG: hypothetical protein HUU20_27785 [Pirellulales bacterium]|nr:hypothetical protein [Pirellulales bacterium]
MRDEKRRRQFDSSWTPPSAFCLPPSAFFLVLAIWLGAVAVWNRSTRGESGGWHDTRTFGPLVCRADFSLESIDPVLRQLAQLQIDLNDRLGVRPAAEPIELYLFRQEWTYRNTLSRHFPNVPYRRALYVKTGGRGMVFAYWSREFEIDLRHECTHALLHAALPVVPLWLDEGLAEYFEIAPDERASGSPYLSGVRWMARFGITPRLEKLEKKIDVGQMGGSEYRDSWAWVHFMLHGPQAAREELTGYLGDIQNHCPPGLLSQRLQQRLPDCDRQFGSHFKSWTR